MKSLSVVQPLSAIAQTPHKEMESKFIFNAGTLIKVSVIFVWNQFCILLSIWNMFHDFFYLFFSQLKMCHKATTLVK